MLQVNKPPVPQLGSMMTSPGLGSMRSTMKAVTAQGGVELAGVACGLQVVEHLLVNVAKVFAFGQVIEIDLGDFVDHLKLHLSGQALPTGG